MSKQDNIIESIIIDLYLHESDDKKILFLEKKIEELSKDQLDSLLIMASRYYGFNLQMIKLIIDAGANPRVNDDEPFIQSCRRNDTDVAMFFLELGASLNSQNGKAFMSACNSNQTEIVKFLLEQGMKIPNEAIESALVGESDENIVLFLESGLSPNLILKMFLKKVMKIVGSSYYDNMLQKINEKDPDYHKVIKEMAEEGCDSEE